MHDPTVTHEREIDRLYGVPLDAFTAARDELARSLRAEGPRAAADEVKRLRKPNLVAWALNQVARAMPERVQALIDAGDRLADAQRELVSGGDREKLRSAAVAERELIEELVALGEQELSGAGHTVGVPLQSKLRATVHAVAAGSEAREKLKAGRLVHDYEVSDLGLPLAAARAGTAAPAQPARGSRAGATAERKRAAAQNRLERARAQLGERRAALTEAERRVAEARGAAARAASALARAEADAERARAELAAATARASELERSLRSF